MVVYGSSGLSVKGGSCQHGHRIDVVLSTTVVVVVDGTVVNDDGTGGGISYDMSQVSSSAIMSSTVTVMVIDGWVGVMSPYVIARYG